MFTRRPSGGVDFYAQAWRIWLRAAFGLRWGSSGALGGVRESFLRSCWDLRRSLWSSLEVTLESPKVIFEFLRTIFFLRFDSELWIPFSEVLRDYFCSRIHFRDNEKDFWAHRIGSELQLLRCLLLNPTSALVLGQ